MMNAPHLTRAPRAYTPPGCTARAGFLPAACLFSALLAHAAAPPAAARQQPATPPQQGAPAAAAANATPLGDDESENDEEVAAKRPRVTDPGAVMRSARVVYVRSNTVFVEASEVEDSLRKRKEFRAWGMTVTRNEGEADLIIEVERKALTRRFTFSVIDPRTMLVVTSGKTRSVLFGKKIPNKIADKFTNRLKAVRPL